MESNKLIYLLATILLSFSGCMATAGEDVSPMGQYYKEIFSAQVVNPDAPEDPSPADTLPGPIGSDIYKKRYIKSMTEKKKDDGDSVNQQLSDLN